LPKIAIGKAVGRSQWAVKKRRKGLPMADDENRKLEFVGGQVHALMGFALAVIDTHPEPERLARAIDTFGQVTLARAEGVLVSDRYIDGIQDVMNRLKRGVETAPERRELHNKDEGSGDLQGLA
jgi:hypothetical protein